MYSNKKGDQVASWTSVHFPEQAAPPPDHFLHHKGGTVASWTSVRLHKQALRRLTTYSIIKAAQPPRGLQSTFKNSP